MELLAICLLCALLAAIILPWVNLVRLNSQERRLQELSAELAGLKRERLKSQRSEVDRVAESSTGIEPPAAEVEQSRAEELASPPPMPRPIVLKAPVVVGRDAERDTVKIDSVCSGAVPNSVVPDAPDTTDASASAQDWFSKVAVWVGAIALLMAGFYMVKFSIDSGWMTARVRVLLTTGFGVLLSASGCWIGMKATQTANARIGQALSGAGVACLYFGSYASVHLYGLLSTSHGFISMVCVTALAVMLSLRNGAPVALMGLIGGFLTPLLMQTEASSSIFLFSYLFLLFCGAHYLCMRKGWWGLLLGSLVSVYLWSAYLIVVDLNQSLQHLEGTLLFVVGICAVNALWSVTNKLSKLSSRARWLIAGIRVVAWGGGLLQSLVLVWMSGFAGVDLSLFALLSLGALLLAVLRETEYLWAIWVALTAVAIAAVAYPNIVAWVWLAWPCSLLALFFVVGHWMGLRSSRSMVWRGFSLSSALLLTPLLYVNRSWLVQLEGLAGGFWLLLCGASALCVLAAGEHLRRREESKDSVGEYTAFAFFLMGFGLWADVPMEYLPHAIGGLWVVGLLYWSFRGLERMQLMQSVLGAAWLILMLPSVGEAVAYFFNESFSDADRQTGLIVTAWGCGLLALGYGFYPMREGSDSRVIALMKWCFGIVLLLAVVTTYQWLDQSVLPEEWLSELVSGGLTALLALGALAMSRLATRYRRGVGGSYLLSVLVGLRVVCLHIGGAGAEGDDFFVNALCLQFGVPFVAAFLIAWMCAEVHKEGARRVYQVAAMLLGFIWSTFLVQDYYGGSYLLQWSASDSEVYTYSVVWLLLAVAYQSVGLWRQQRVIHIGSLVLLFLTVGKVFMVDASELEGIFRVFSFLGLGVALIGIGFFYNKVVFARQLAD